MAKKKKIWLSPSGLSALDRCPRCFWLQYNKKIRQPEGIVSRLANRFDVIIKKYFDQFRETGDLPPLIDGKVEGRLENPFVETYFYHHDENYGYYGKLDECLVLSDGRRTPVDHKTSSSDPREKTTIPAYQHQLNSYAWLLEENKKPTSGIGHLIYFFPDFTKAMENGADLIVHIETLQTDPNMARERFLNAIEVLKKPLPEPSNDCPFCAWREKVDAVLEDPEGTRGTLFE